MLKASHTQLHKAYHTQIVLLKMSLQNPKLYLEDSYGMTKLGGNWIENRLNTFETKQKIKL